MSNNPTPPPAPDYRLTFRPLRSGAPVWARLRHLLKFALRSLGLRCVRVEKLEAPAAQPPAPPPGVAQAGPEAGRPAPGPARGGVC